MEQLDCLEAVEPFIQPSDEGPFKNAFCFVTAHKRVMN